MTLPIIGAGFRRPHFKSIKTTLPKQVGFFELAPENWINVGGERKKEIEFIAAHYPLIAHGLSLSIGGIAPLNVEFLHQVKTFLEHFNIPLYSEHLSYCTDQAQLYDLLPIPFTEDAVHYVAKRVKQVQDIIERPFALENVSYYLSAGAEMTEVEFINAVLAESGCDLLLDVNNIYVNSVNHNYDPREFIKQLQPNRIAYLHVAGHYQQAEDLIIDTHGSEVIDPVWDLLKYTYQHFGIVPTVLERDNDIPDFTEILAELEKIKSIQQTVQSEALQI